MLYTGQGDAGFTRVIGGPMLPKCDVRLETLGALDEAQAHLGVARAMLAQSPWDTPISRVQAALRQVMADIAVMPGGSFTTHYLTEDDLLRLEEELAAWEPRSGGFTGFAIPGSSLPEAHLHLARTVIRRAERAAVALAQGSGLGNPLVIQFLNRLSSWVYALTLLVGPVERPAAPAA